MGFCLLLHVCSVPFLKNHCIDVSRPKFLFYLFSTCVCVCVMCMSIYMHVHMCLCGSTCTCGCMHMEVQSWCRISSSMARCLLRYGLLLSRAHHILPSLASWLNPSTCECLDYRWLSHLADFLYGLCMSKLHSSRGHGESSTKSLVRYPLRHGDHALPVCCCVWLAIYAMPNYKVWLEGDMKRGSELPPAILLLQVWWLLFAGNKTGNKFTGESTGGTAGRNDPSFLVFP